MKPSTALVLDVLSRVESVCASTFVHHYSMARYSARIHELRAMGYVIERSVCRLHEHPHGPVYRYRLVEIPADAVLAKWYAS